jgi:transposase
MSSSKKSYTAEYKQEAVRLVTEGGLSMAQVARDLGLNYNVLARWKRQLAAKGERAFPGKGHPENEELARLRREVDVLRQERDILKKAVGIFSQQPR